MHHSRDGRYTIFASVIDHDMSRVSAASEIYHVQLQWHYICHVKHLDVLYKNSNFLQRIFLLDFK